MGWPALFVKAITILNSLTASPEWSLVLNGRLLMIFADSLDPDQAQQKVGPDLDLSCLTLWVLFLKKKMKIVMLKNICRQQKNKNKIPSML